MTTTAGRMTYRQVYVLCRQVGLSDSAAQTAVMIAAAESKLDPRAIGDVSLQTKKWGPSVGLWQIRSLKAQKGTGKTRDANKLTDPTFNARAMKEISNNGTNWSAWSTYKDGSYFHYLSDAIAAARPLNDQEKAAKPGSGDQASLPGGTGKVGSAPTPTRGTSGAPQDATGGGLDLNVHNASLPGVNVADQVVSALERPALYGAAVFLGVALVGIGLWSVVTP